jgi:hypothetical protein
MFEIRVDVGQLEKGNAPRAMSLMNGERFFFNGSSLAIGESIDFDGLIAKVYDIVHTAIVNIETVKPSITYISFDRGLDKTEIATLLRCGFRDIATGS